MLKCEKVLSLYISTERKWLYYIKYPFGRTGIWTRVTKQVLAFEDKVPIFRSKSVKEEEFGSVWRQEVFV